MKYPNVRLESSIICRQLHSRRHFCASHEISGLGDLVPYILRRLRNDREAKGRTLIELGEGLTAFATGSPEAVARPRLPQNVACGFPALRSSKIGSQHCDSLQPPVPVSALFEGSVFQPPPPSLRRLRAQMFWMPLSLDAPALYPLGLHPSGMKSGLR
jgi:hypothetical protein